MEKRETICFTGHRAKKNYVDMILAHIQIL